MIVYFSLLQSNTMGSLTTGKPYGLKGYFVTLSKVSGDDWGLEAIRLLPTSCMYMSMKEQAIELIRSPPNDCTLEDIQYHRYVREKVERGMRAIEEGRVVSQEEAEKQVKEWLKSSGQNQR